MYETGTATDATDLVQKLETFLTGAGWTIHHGGSVTDGYWLSFQKNSVYGNVWSQLVAGSSQDPGPYIYARCATGFAGSGSGPTGQTGSQPQTTSLNKCTAPFASYYFFEGDDYIHVVVELETGRFRHLHIGEIEKFCTLTGGTYCMGQALRYSANDASRPEAVYHSWPWEFTGSLAPGLNFIYADAGEGAQWFDQRTNQTYRHGGCILNGSASGSADFDQASIFSAMFAKTPSQVNGIAPLFPLRALLRKTTGLWVIAGAPKDVRAISMENYSPGDTITLGSDEWLVFPWAVRRATENDITTDGSLYYGFAYRKNTL